MGRSWCWCWCCSCSSSCSALAERERKNKMGIVHCCCGCDGCVVTLLSVRFVCFPEWRLFFFPVLACFQHIVRVILLVGWWICLPGLAFPHPLLVGWLVAMVHGVVVFVDDKSVSVAGNRSYNDPSKLILSRELLLGAMTGRRSKSRSCSFRSNEKPSVVG